MSTRDIIAPQELASIPEAYQSEHIASISAELLKPSPAPCVLRAPTGSGKTFTITRVIEEVSRRSGTVWFWFVPFANLVQQTESTLASNSSLVHPIRLDRGRNQEPESGMVIISTAAAVARARSRTQGYADGGDDFDRSLAEFRALVKARGLQLGVIIDEAHIGVESQTEFGKFVHWLEPDRLVMATATPKDKKLNDFIGAAGYDGLRTFSVSRDEVVQARLNKRYIEAIIYNLRDSLQGIVDLQGTVLKQAWKRNVRLGKLLKELKVDVSPLLLVQVGNGADAIRLAREQLQTLCGVPADRIGEHSADDPDPVLMASIANDTTKDALIFKQSAGTGFDAPRAFVLASTKSVNDPDFAMQFVGRVMRVHRAIRSSFPKGTVIPEEIDSAYIYLANAESQPGFESAVKAVSELKTNLQGETEALVARATASGAIHLSNRPDADARLFYENSILARALAQGRDGRADDATPSASGGDSSQGFLHIGQTASMFVDPELDLPVTSSAGAAVATKRPKPTEPKTVKDVVESYSVLGINTYPMRRDAFNVPTSLKSEIRPMLGDMATATRSAAARLDIDESLKAMALRVATGKVTETEVHKELNTGRVSRKEVAIVIERRALALAAKEAMKGLPQFEDADAAILLEVLSARMSEAVATHFAAIDEDERPTPAEIRRIERDCAYWVVLRSHLELAEALHAAIADQARLVDAGPLPDCMIFPQEIHLEASEKNIYGVMPPRKADMESLAQVIPIDVRGFLRPVAVELGTVVHRFADFDGGFSMGANELEFARALDRASFVKWWHRNPDRKPYSVQLVRGEHKNYFYPDFIVFLEHFRGDSPMLRLIETKESTKDASNKSKRFSDFYGRVMFITENKGALRWINEDGSLGGKIDPDNLDSMREWLRASRPEGVVQS